MHKQRNIQTVGVPLLVHTHLEPLGFRLWGRGLCGFSCALLAVSEIGLEQPVQVPGEEDEMDDQKLPDAALDGIDSEQRKQRHNHTDQLTQTAPAKSRHVNGYSISEGSCNH